MDPFSDAALAGDEATLRRTMAACRALLDANPLADRPRDWARAQARLGAAQAVLGERLGDAALLAEAAECYAAATQGYTRAGAPLDWARMQRNRGAALALLGEQGGETGALAEAVACYRAALEEYTAPTPDRAMALSNLGHALRVLGERQADTALALEAVAACEAALALTSRADAPRDWAMTQTNLANALVAAGAPERAVTAYREALAGFDAPEDAGYRTVVRYNLGLAERRAAAAR